LRETTVDSETRNTIDVLEIQTLEEGEFLRVEDLGRSRRGHFLDNDMGMTDDPTARCKSLYLIERTRAAR
jgi:hypothetical protein